LLFADVCGSALGVVQEGISVSVSRNANAVRTSDVLSPSITEKTALEIYSMPGHLIRRLQQASAAIFDNEIRQAGFDLTPVQFASLTMIAANPGLDQATLAQGIAYDRVTIGGVVDRLEQKGLVRREIAAKDRRARNLYLQPLGERVLAEARPVVVRVQEAILRGLSDAENEQFCLLLRKALDTVGNVSRTPIKAPQAETGE
jgi:MarR family transcriptional regulator, temperature-dependent positive regulator of motility